MSGTGDTAEIDKDTRRALGTKGYSSHHPVPNIHLYKERQQQRQQLESTPSPETSPESKLKRFKSIFRSRNSSRASLGSESLYEARNRNSVRYSWVDSDHKSKLEDDEHKTENGETRAGDAGSEKQITNTTLENPDKPSPAVQSSETDAGKNQSAPQQGAIGDENDDKGIDKSKEKDDGEEGAVDTSEVAGDQTADARTKRKAMKNVHSGGDRQVTDPVTHLSTIVHDFTQQELENAPRSLDPERVGTGLSLGDRSNKDIETETKEMQDVDVSSKHLFPPPSSEALQRDLGKIYAKALRFGLNFVALVLFSALLIGGIIQHLFRLSERATLYVTGSTLVSFSLFAGVANRYISGWLEKKVDGAFEDHVWNESSKQESKVRSELPESTMWLNSFVASVWPLINPDLFTSIADTLEDVMQASLPPKAVRMVAVTDIGQGAIAPRILGARWLPVGAANQDVSFEAQNKQTKETESDTAQKADSEETTRANEAKESPNEGLEAETGDFTNMELMFSYRTLPEKGGFKEKSKAAHIYLVFYLPGNVPFPVYVSLRGIVGKMRLRMQLSPDPPFVNLCTITFLGQPKVDVSCIPITRKFLNIMDLPVISSFVQSSIDAALSEYVAPRSLTLDLKQMLQGDDFKKNTETKGILVVNIKRAYDFKEADAGMGPFKQGSSDSYVSVGWAKFGKPVWSTRVILKDMNPVWEETAYVLVGPEEIDAGESLRVQLWDSDRLSADDDLGRIEIALADLMKNAKGKRIDRSDGFIAMDADEKMPGKLDWSVGYYEKVHITQDQFDAQEAGGIHSLQELKEQVTKDAQRKLREADRDVSDEADQQRAQDFQEHEDQLICKAPPPEGYPSGILSVQIHNITGLQVAKLKKSRDSEGDEYENATEVIEDDLPSAYATIILNGRPIFRTRTKPKNAKPFFNATTERFIRDWANTEVIVSIRDARTHENDPLLGFVYLPLERLFHGKSQVNGTFPLSGGAGFGKIRISMVFRSIELKLPSNLLGWDYGTIELTGSVKAEGLPEDLQKLKIKVKTHLGSGKLINVATNEWKGKKDRKIRLAVSSRYSTTLIFEFQNHTTLGGNKVAGFGILWLKDVPDDEDKEVKIPIWHGSSDFERAKANCLEDMGEKAGTLTVPLKLYSGLSEYHKPLAKQRPEIGRVMEVLDAASDQNEKDEEIPDDDNDDNDSSSSSSDDEDTLEKDGSRNAVSQIKEYKKHQKVLHRKQRGVMQWKTARTADWLRTKANHGFEKLTQGTLSHHDREPGIETEV